MIRTLMLCWVGACVLLTCGCGSDSGQNALKQGMAAFQDKNYSAAITFLTRATQRISNSADLYYHLGAAHLAKGELEPATAAFEAAVELKPSHGEALAGLGQVYYYKKEPLKAQDCFTQALAAEVASDEAKAGILNGLALVASEQQIGRASCRERV